MPAECSTVAPARPPRETADLASTHYEEQAVRSYASGQALRATGPGAFALFAVLLSSVIALFLLAVAARVEVTGSAHGRVQASSGPHPAVEIFAFVSARDRAALAVGRAVRVEPDQLPLGELGVLSAVVARISDRPAASAEIAAATAETRPSRTGASAMPGIYRVDLAFVRDPVHERLAPHLGPNAAVTLHYTLHRRRVIDLVLDALQ